MFLSVFYKKKLTMVYSLPNMRSLVSCWQICAPNYVQVQLLVVVISVWLGSDYIHPVIHNTINSWIYMCLLWIKRTWEFQIICDTFFSDTKLYYTFHIFLLPYLDYLCLFSYVSIANSLQMQEGFVIHCKLITEWIESTLSRMLFPVQ